MEDQLKEAIRLRSEKEMAKAETLFQSLIKANPNQGNLYYHYAWLCDNMERETEAIPLYEKALSLSLSPEEKKGAYLGLASTYRVTGNYQLSVDLLRQAIAEFPQQKEFDIFLAMALYNIKEHKESMEILLKHIAANSKNKGVQSYAKAIQYYSDKLDQIFD